MHFCANVSFRNITRRALNGITTYMYGYTEFLTVFLKYYNTSCTRIIFWILRTYYIIVIQLWENEFFDLFLFHIEIVILTFSQFFFLGISYYILL